MKVFAAGLVLVASGMAMGQSAENKSASPTTVFTLPPNAAQLQFDSIQASAALPKGAVPIPTTWPALSVEKIPTRWPQMKITLVGGSKPLAPQKQDK